MKLTSHASCCVRMAAAENSQILRVPRLGRRAYTLSPLQIKVLYQSYIVELDDNKIINVFLCVVMSQFFSG